MKLCLGCMNKYDESLEVCPECGYVAGQEALVSIHMNPGTVLKGENSTYTIGRVIGNGSFGVTYIAWDNMLERKVAIKEYLPSEYATRAAGQNSVAIFGEKNTQFCTGMEKFIDEARRIAKFEKEDGIVKIYDHFYENETAYIVMEYLDGQTLTDYLEEIADDGTITSKIIDPQTAVDMLMPIMNSLKNVHSTGIIHRDIAPDNIMITKNGDIKLIDFGAARYASSSHSKSLSVIVKQGYSPEEQYRRRGDQGPHTDVYSIAATLYKMITGITPPDALERRANLENSKKNILKSIRKYNKNVPRNIENAIYNALNIKIEDRTPDIEHFIEELTSEKPVKIRDQSISLIDRLGWKRWQIVSVSTAAAAVSTLIILLVTGVIHFTNPFKEEIVIPDGMTRVPALVNQQLASAEDMITTSSLLYSISGKEYSDFIPKDYILSQNINPGSLTEVNTMLSIKVSGGPELVTVPSLLGLKKDKAEELIKENKLTIRIVESYNSFIAEGYVVSQSEEAGQQIAKNSEIIVTVSKGKDPEAKVEEKEITLPNLVGKKYEEVMTLASTMEFMIEVSDRKYSDDFDEDVVMMQDPGEGTVFKNTDPVKLVVSLGKKYIYMPDVTYFTEEEADGKLAEGELKVKKRYEESETVEAGLVMSQSIESGKKILSGTEVEIVISKGRGSFDMPDVTGDSESAALSTLKGKGLVVTVSYANDSNVKSGNVISQSVSAGTKVTAGTKVALVISTGEKLYTVPDVVGMSEKSAKSELENEKFSVSSSTAYSDDVEEGKVISQTLAPGGSYKKGTKIALVVSKGKEPFTLSFDGRGGSVSGDSRTMHYGDKYGSLPDASQTGADFVGWYTDPTGGNKVSTDSTYSIRADQTLYAHWKASTYSVTFDGNGGTSPSAITVTYGSTYGTLPTPTRSNYNFDGWYTDKSGGSKISSSTKVQITSTQKLYAHWSPCTYKVSFDSNGGSAASAINVTYGSTYGTLPTTSRDYYTFDGWYTSSSGGNKITNSTSVNISGNQTLYAHWTENQWSAWASSLPDSVNTNAYMVEKQYRYADRSYEYTESNESSKSGWEKYDSYIQYGSWQTGQAYKIDLQQGKVVDTDTIDVDETSFNAWVSDGDLLNVHYYAYNGARNYDSEGHYDTLVKGQVERNSSSLIPVTTFTNPITNADMVTYKYNGEIWYSGVDENDGGAHFFSKNYKWRTKTTIYKYRKWGAYSSWSSWSNTSYSSSDSRKVEVRYRYKKK